MCQKLESILENDSKMQAFIKKRLPGRQVEMNFFEFGSPINIQSGGNYNLKLGASPSSNHLASDTILLTVCGKYRDLCCNCQRTLLIGPTTDQKDAYQFLLDLFEVALN